MNTIGLRHTMLFEELGDRAIGLEHHFLDHSMRIVARCQSSADRTALFREIQQGLGQIEIERSRADPPSMQTAHQATHRFQHRQKSGKLTTLLFDSRRPRIGKDSGDLRIRQTRVAANHRPIDLYIASTATAVVHHLGNQNQAVTIGHERT